MPFGVVIALIMIGASAVQCLAVTAFASARSQTRLKWLALNCFAAAGYSLGCLLSVSESFSQMAHWCAGPMGYSMAAIYFSSIIRFFDITFERKPWHWERVVHRSLHLMALLVWIPGLVFTADFAVRQWEFIGTTYSFPVGTSFIWIAGLVMFAGVFSFIAAIRQCSLPLQLSGTFFGSCAAIDVLVFLGAWEFTWCAALGTMVFLTVLTLREARTWAAEANQLSDLKQNLEKKVEQRSAELAASLEKLNEHNRLASLGRLAASIGHEINNPLTYVICNLELLQQRIEGEDVAIGHTLEGASRIARIVKELHILSRPVDESAFRSVDLAAIASTAAQTVQHHVTDLKQLELHCDQNCFVWGNPDRLTQLFVNLLTNSLGALPEDGITRMVRVHIYREKGETIAIVRDSGHGIPEEIQPRLFEPFFSTKDNSLGLGLAICRLIVDEANGELTFGSKPGKGTTFRVAFPEHSGKPESEVESPRIDSPPETKGRILVIDDEPAVLSSFKGMLPKSELVTISDAHAALELMLKEQFDVVFCDVVMPGISGIELWKHLQDRGRIESTKFILMSGGSPKHYEFKHRTLEAVFLQKPFRVAEIYDLLRNES